MFVNTSVCFVEANAFISSSKKQPYPVFFQGEKHLSYMEIFPSLFSKAFKA